MTTSPTNDSFEIDRDTPLGQAIARAEAAFDRGDVSAMDSAFQAAVGLVDAYGPWLGIAYDHVARLIDLGAFARALPRCAGYLARAGPHHELLLLRAEIRSAIGMHEHARADAEAARNPDLTADQQARLLRVEAFAAVEAGDPEASARLLTKARQTLESADKPAGVAVTDDDRRQIARWRGEQAGAPPEGPHQTVPDRLAYAAALRNELRYEEALGVVRPILEESLDPLLRPHVLVECILLLRLTRQFRAAARLVPELKKAVADSPDPALVEVLTRLSIGDVAAAPVSARPDQRAQHARRLIADGKLDDARRLIRALRLKARTDVEVSSWRLAAGELELAGLHAAGEQAALRRAAHHFEMAIDRARPVSLAEIRVRALQLCGDTQYRLGNGDRALECWHEASTVEERLADCQITDKIRVGMLAHSPTAHELWIRAAADRHDRNGSPGTASAIVVAMEAARGATILRQLVPENEIRSLPRPADLAGAQQWLAGVLADLPHDQAIWLTHAIADAVHHVLIGHDLLEHIRIPADLEVLTEAISDHELCWSDPDVLEASIRSGEFDRSLGDVAALLHIDDVLRKIPSQLSRIALAPAGSLATIPFAAIRLPGTWDHLVHRYALSELICLSARDPLRRRSRRQRGDRSLLVRTGDITLATGPRRRTVLEGDQATVPAVTRQVARRRRRMVRFDGHGNYDEANPEKSWLQLEPAGPSGRLTPEALQDMDFHRCGTLMLGACESGVGERRGRDERMGFVRAGLLAGSASVIAARWIAKDAVAATVLDRFERYARFLPRDVALQRAQLDVCAGGPGIPTKVPFYAHPARWACWSIYGATCYQTRAGSLRRRLRETRDNWRNRARPR